MKILVFLPLSFLPRLRERFPQVEFKEADSDTDLEEEGPNLVTIDVSEDVGEITVLDDLESLSFREMGLPMTLKMLMKIKAVESAVMIRVPAGYDENESFEKVSAIISDLL